MQNPLKINEPLLQNFTWNRIKGVSMFNQGPGLLFLVFISKV